MGMGWNGMGWDGDEFNDEKEERGLAETGECTYVEALYKTEEGAEGFVALWADR